MLKRKGGRRKEDKAVKVRVVFLICRHFPVWGNNSPIGIRPNSHISKETERNFAERINYRPSKIICVT